MAVLTLPATNQSQEKPRYCRGIEAFVTAS